MPQSGGMCPSLEARALGPPRPRGPQGPPGPLGPNPGAGSGFEDETIFGIWPWHQECGPKGPALVRPDVETIFRIPTLGLKTFGVRLGRALTGKPFLEFAPENP